MSWLLIPTFSSRINLRLACILSVLLICIFYFWLPSTWVGGEVQELLHNVHGDGHSSSSTPNDEAGESLLPSPAAPTSVSVSDAGTCALRFGTEYLRSFTRTTTSYCDEDSTSSLTCFSHKTHQKIDSFCVGEPAHFATEGKFHLDCVLRDWTENDMSIGAQKFSNFPLYWYNTGPHAIFSQHVKMDRMSLPTRVSETSSSGFMFLIQREDNNQNLWHTMMEIMSLTMSLDILRTTLNPATGKPFITLEDFAKSKVVFLDDLADGPYFDLWSIFSGKPPVRLNEISPLDASSNRIVVPLPGSSNPFWQGDWLDLNCGESVLLQLFSRRVIDFCQAPKDALKTRKSLRLTLIDRKEKRRLLHKQEYFAELQRRHPDVEMRFIDYAGLTFQEQVRISHSTDILVGVHGAGLTHGMFLPPNSTIVEIQPPELKHKGFNNMANALGHRYFKKHGIQHEISDSNGDWQHDDVYMKEDEFMSLMSEAIKSSGR